jgi:hypothetical protein
MHYVYAKPHSETWLGNMHASVAAQLSRYCMAAAQMVAIPDGVLTTMRHTSICTNSQRCSYTFLYTITYRRLKAW